MTARTSSVRRPRIPARRPAPTINPDDAAAWDRHRARFPLGTPAERKARRWGATQRLTTHLLTECELVGLISDHAGYLLGDETRRFDREWLRRVLRGVADLVASEAHERAAEIARGVRADREIRSAKGRAAR